MPDLNHLNVLVALLVALSVASERLVEIIKNLSPFLRENKPEEKDGPRKAALQVLAVASGIATAFLARPAFPTGDLPMLASPASVLALGLLASGGSGFWNSILSYVLLLKNAKKEQIQRLRMNAASLPPAARAA